jgi:hypothetical protein
MIPGSLLLILLFIYKISWKTQIADQVDKNIVSQVDENKVKTGSRSASPIQALLKAVYLLSLFQNSVGF